MMASHRVVTSSIIVLFLFFTLTEARDILVGGKTNAWKIPSSESQSLNKWAKAVRFQIGDTLVWNYDPNKDSVFEVTINDYKNCTTSSPLASYKDGNTKVKLEKSGPHYFISGDKGHCEMGQKLVVVVLSPRHRGSVGISPAPSPVEFQGPSVAPSPTSEGSNLRGSLMVIFVSVVGLFFLF